MEFKRGKIRRAQLDEMAKTMSVIPISELMLMIGEYGPGYYSISNLNSLNSWLSSHVMDTQTYVEAVYYFFNDGTYGVYIDPTNTKNFGQPGGQKNPVTGQFSISGKYFNGWGHTHVNYSTPTVYTNGKEDDITAKNYFGLPTSIYYQGHYYAF